MYYIDKIIHSNKLKILFRYKIKIVRLKEKYTNRMGRRVVETCVI